MADFLSGLGDLLDQQFYTGNGGKLTNLDLVENGHTSKFGKLGKFANQVDQSSKRSYAEEGFAASDMWNTKPKNIDIMMQEPNIVVLIKKRAFSSLAENYRPDLMEKEDRLFYRATKILFQNKCNQIAAFERLSKIARISSEIGRVDYHLLPVLFGITDTLDSGAFGQEAAQSLTKFKSIIDKVRSIVNLSDNNAYTTWITNLQSVAKTTFGEGTGVIELTNVASLNTTTSVSAGGGGFNLTISDPYNLMLISNLDIENALSMAASSILNNSFTQFGLKSLDQTLQESKIQLNSIRAQRGANPIIFTVDPGAFLSKRVRAIIDRIGFEIIFEGITAIPEFSQLIVDPTAKKGSDEVGNDGLTEQEIRIFSNIVSGTLNQLMILENSRTNTKNKNIDTNYIRKKLRLHYANKLIIQPMDVVHIYIDSKAKIDNKILGGLQSSFTQLGFLQDANTALTNLKDWFNTNNSMTVEKSIFVGNDFPTWLWYLMRNQFVSDKAGTHVFAGVVESATSRYNGGTFHVAVEGKDNFAYFDYGIVNFKPSMNVFNSSLYDPLTPFDLKFDTATGAQTPSANGTGAPNLLKENEELFDSRFLKYKNGLFAGRKPTSKNFSQDSDRTSNNQIRRLYYDPDGLVYRWKEGISTLSLFGDSFSNTPIQNQTIPAQTSDPYAGQDVMNILSLLITGEPYNFATFYKAARDFDSFGRDPTTGEDPSVSYFRGLQTDLKYRNLIYGDFIPFKKLSINDSAFKDTVNNQVRATNFDFELRDLLTQRAQLTDQLLSLTGKETAGASVDVTGTITNKIREKDAQIWDRQSDIIQELNKSNKTMRIIGDDISFDSDPGLTLGNNSKTSFNNDDLRRQLRRKTNFLTRRLAWKVRGNEDINLLVVDDSYDKDYDIQAFEKSFVNPELFRSSYITVSEQIKSVSKLLDLEVFANTQGHIEIRPPQYNRMPSSVFYRMLKLKEELGIQIYPQFLEDLFVNQLEVALEKVEILEDEIRLYCIALGKTNDTDAQNFINSMSSSSGLNTPTASTTGFIFLSKGPNAKITAQNLRPLLIQSNPDSLLDANGQKTALESAQQRSSILADLERVSQQTGITNIFDIVSRSNFISDSFFVPDEKNTVSVSTDIQKLKNAKEKQDTNTISAIDIVSKRLQSKTGQLPDFDQLFTHATNGINSAALVSAVDILEIVQNISTRLTDRQRAIKVAATAIKNVQEALVIDDKSRNSNKFITAGLSNNKNIPEILEHMIEDESYDDYGPGSGQRYIIENRHIISDSIVERRPQYTALEVEGRFAENFIPNNQLPGDLHAFEIGNALVTVAAVDYDLWRMYGVSVPQHVTAPYLVDPLNQCPQFAVSLLNRARQHIFSGSLELVGNEYMQPGEVVFAEHRNLLFYVDQVTHNFTYGGSFGTSLSVSWGHNPGEYIPTYLDVIGKVLYRNKDSSVNNINVRQGSSFNQEHLGVIVGNVNIGSLDNSGLSVSSSNQRDIIDGPFAKENSFSLNNIITQGLTTLGTSTDNFQPTLELRIFFDSSDSKFDKTSVYANQLANTVKDFLLGKNDMLEKGPNIASGKNLKTGFIDERSISIVKVNAATQTTDEFRAPSTKAYGAARNAINSRGMGSGSISADDIDTIIWQFVVDIWITFKKPDVK